MSKDKKKEAIKRMKSLGLMDECIKAFEERNEVWASETNGILFDLNADTDIRREIKDEIKRFEEENQALVYHCIISGSGNNCLVSLFYVSNEEDEWYLDWEDMAMDYACCKVLNLNDPFLSEIGSIAFKKMNGGLVRIG